MKTKLKKKYKYKWAMILLLAVLLCFILYYLVDIVFNGAFREWFSQYYMSVLPYDDAWGPHQTYILEWELLKPFLLKVMIGNVVFWIVIMWIMETVNEKRTKRKTASEISRMISEYMEQKESGEELFPEEYAEIAARMAGIKSIMRHHEQVLKDEASRKNDLITYLAHDLKTPLTSIIGYMSFLDEMPDLTQEQRERYVGIILDKSYRLERLMNEFFEITRYNLQEIVLEKENVCLSYMLLQITDEFYPILRSHDNVVCLKADDELFVYADAIKLARVFNNILKNAVSYSYQGTEIEIRTEKSETKICIFFKNKGKTIPEEKLSRIFEKFFRMDEARGSNSGGAGLGLAIAKDIVEAHSGRIWAKSTAESITFCVELPLL